MKCTYPFETRDGMGILLVYQEHELAQLVWEMDLATVEDWMQLNQLKLNPGKTGDRDDIIKRHKKDQTDAQAVGNQRRQQLRNRNAYGYGRPWLRARVQRSLQGPNRLRRGFGQQQYNRQQWRGTVPGPRRRTAVTLNGVSPLNRQISTQEGNQSEEGFSKSGDSGQTAAQTRPLQHPRRFRTLGAAVQGPARSGRFFTLNRRPAFQQKQIQQRRSKPGFYRGQNEASVARKPPWMRRWQLAPNPEAVLTVSVANPQAGQGNVPFSRPGANRPFLRGRRPPFPRPTKPQPKGVMLRFNFRAMANQTGLTLDERFSGLRNKWRFMASRNAGRMVTMP
ncbi:PREDICTED: UAP56-interacting factor-like [Gavialis gangeticus]|uniref:UAP56-interacting factor-like n=1 Tax=Gavialis gangeticus TaxID=94835 RepID=UPI00092F5637|nr:PREDICTED: UAP56-interacting factor-like [Gavialis gangeticus]